jgi:hypothetical protein
MRINEILVEGPFSAISKAAGNIKQGYRAGYDAMDRVLSPSKWGSKGTTTNGTSTDIKPHIIKDVLNKAVDGKKLYIDDIAALKAAKVKIENDELQFKGNKSNLINAIRAVYNSKPINDNQKQLLSQLASSL